MDDFVVAIRDLCDNFLNQSGPFVRSVGDGMREHPLSIMLLAAVPLWTWEVELMPEAAREGVLTTWRKDAVDAVASRGDLLLFKSRTPGETAGVFNHLARGVAALSFTPGGVCVFGYNWCAKHHPGGVAVSRFTPCSHCEYESQAEQ